MYLSPAVRTIRDDPTADVSAKLAIRTDADTDPVESAVERHGTVEEITRFGTVHASVDESDVAELLDSLPPVEAVETRITVADQDGSEG